MLEETTLFDDDWLNHSERQLPLTFINTTNVVKPYMRKSINQDVARTSVVEVVAASRHVDVAGMPVAGADVVAPAVVIPVRGA